MTALVIRKILVVEQVNKILGGSFAKYLRDRVRERFLAYFLRSSRSPDILNPA
jgi:hypothetical protein